MDTLFYTDITCRSPRDGTTQNLQLRAVVLLSQVRPIMLGFRPCCGSTHHDPRNIRGCWANDHGHFASLAVRRWMERHTIIDNFILRFCPPPIQPIILCFCTPQSHFHVSTQRIPIREIFVIGEIFAAIE